MNVLMFVILILCLFIFRYVYIVVVGFVITNTDEYQYRDVVNIGSRGLKIRKTSDIQDVISYEKPTKLRP